MNIFLYAAADSTIYKHKDLVDLNTGFDEILELENTYSELSGHRVSRFLMRFDFENSGVSDDILVNSEYFLNLKITESKEVKHKGALQVFPVAESWEEGVGRRYDTEVSYEGVTWKSRSNTRLSWESEGASFIRSTESGPDAEELVCEYKFVKRTSDVSLNITKIVEKWITGDIENNGLLIKFKDENLSAEGKIDFFSKDTNTIYSPYVRIGYNDYYFDPCECIPSEKLECLYETQDEQTNTTGSTLTQGSPCIISGSAGLVSGSDCIVTSDWSGLPSGSPCIISGSAGLVSGSDCAVSGSLSTPNDTSDCNAILSRTTTLQQSKINHITEDDVVIKLRGIKAKVSVKESVRIKVGVREKYPPKTFQKHSNYSQNNYVDHPIYYSIRDADTHEMRVPMDKYSRINCDANGHYFDFDFGCLSVGRIYEFIIRMETPTQTLEHIDKVKFMVTT